MTDWTEEFFQPHAQRYRWRWEGVNADGYLHGLEIQKWEGEDIGWLDMPNYNFKDFFRMGFIAARKASTQTELSL